MLLRRISKHVTDQNWFAVLVDFFIVVVGVFIGIQVANWNEALKAKQSEKIYIERMHNDITFAQEFVEETINRRIQGFQLSINMIQLMDGDENNLNNEYVDCYFPSNVSIEVQLPFLNSINELMATGKVNLMTDSAIRNAILELQNRSEILRHFQDQTTGTMVSITDEFSEAIRLRTHTDVNNEIRLKRQCNLKVLHGNNRFINAINDHIDITDAFINVHLIPWSRQLDELHELIDQSLQLNHGDK